MKSYSTMSKENLKLERVVMEVFGGCNYTCQMCPQSNPGRGKSWTRKMSLIQFEKILNEIVPRFGKPQINLEGSGEPTMAKDLDKYIEIVKNKNLKCFMYCNGARLNGDFMRRVVDAGIDFIRISVIGYNREKYKEWMNIDNFELIKKNIVELQEYVKTSKSSCKVSTYHLITDNNNIEKEVEFYKANVISKVNSTAYIWKMHNWSGNYENKNPRKLTDRKTCGRPFAPEITVRAGGTIGRTGAMVPCCQTLGPPNEEKSILGHLDNESFEDVYWGNEYKKLRQAHQDKRFDDIEYCKNCDFLYEDPEVLVWSNDPEAKVGHMLGTSDDFILHNYTK